jgi:hypothetical protein
LEYVVNRYIFGVPSTITDIFQITGAAHCINWDETYQKNKIATRGHFSSCNVPYPKDAEKIIWVKHNQILDFVLLVNVFERCSPDAVNSDDFNAKDIQKYHLDVMFDKNANPKDLRNNWFNKLEEFHNKKITSLKHKTNLPTFDFDYRSFFNLLDFILELERSASFLSMTLKFDNTLVKLWKEFMRLNLGFHMYQKTNYLLDKIIENSDEIINDDWRIHSYINYRLSKIFRIYDGPLFEIDCYPKNTVDIHNLIINHINTFDFRF